MNPIVLDLIFAAVAVFFILLGVFRGFVLTALKFCRLFITVLIAYWLGGLLGNWMASLIKNPTVVKQMGARLGGYLIAFVLAFILFTVVYMLIKAIKGKLPLVNVADKILGGVLGALTAFVILVLAASVVKAFFGDQEVYTGSYFVRFLGNLKLGFLSLDGLLSSVSKI